jgi:hypothetical protein
VEEKEKCFLNSEYNIFQKCYLKFYKSFTRVFHIEMYFCKMSLVPRTYSTYLPTYPPTHPPTYLPTYLPTCLFARQSVRPFSQSCTCHLSIHMYRDTCSCITYVYNERHLCLNLIKVRILLTLGEVK